MSRFLLVLIVFAGPVFVDDAVAQTRCQPTVSRPCPPPSDRSANAPQPYQLPELGKLKDIPDRPAPPIMSLPDGATIGFGNGGVGLERKF